MKGERDVLGTPKRAHPVMNPCEGRGLLPYDALEPPAPLSCLVKLATMACHRLNRGQACHVFVSGRCGHVPKEGAGISAK